MIYNDFENNTDLDSEDSENSDLYDPNLNPQGNLSPNQGYTENPENIPNEHITKEEYSPEVKVYDIDENKLKHLRVKWGIPIHTDSTIPSDKLPTHQRFIKSRSKIEIDEKYFPDPDLEIKPTDSTKEKIRKRQKRLDIWDAKNPQEESPEAKSTFMPISGAEQRQRFLASREDLLQTAIIPDGPVKDRLILSWLSFAHRIAKAEGSQEMIRDVPLFSKWYSGSSYSPFKHSTEQAWREAIETYLPIEIIATRSFVFTLESSEFIRRLKEGFEHAGEITDKGLPMKKPDGSINIEAFFDWFGRAMRIANDFATEFFIKPSRTDSQDMISMYSSMYRNAIRQFYTFEEAIKYKNSQIELQNDFIKRHPTITPPPLRPVSAMYSERSEWSPIRAVAEFKSADIVPFIDLSEIRHGITGESISRPNQPVKKVYTPWEGVFDVMGKECGYVIVKGESNEYRKDKRELYRTLCKAETVLGSMLEYLVYKTSFKGKYVLEIDPLLAQIKGQKALTMDINQAYYFASLIAELEHEKRQNTPSKL